MSVRETRRAAAVRLMADHLLEAGLAGASLRVLATAAGTSDRMLLYYFIDKDELIAAALGEVAGRMVPVLEAAAGPQPRPYEVLLRELGETLRRPQVQPFMRLWLELAAFAARGEQPYLAVAGAMADGFLAWIAARLDVAPGDDRTELAARLMTTVDGAVILDAVGRPAVADAAIAAN
jgi:AcrR family transcriptional regulator